MSNKIIAEQSTTTRFTLRVLCCLCLVLAETAAAQAPDLMLYPARVVLERNQRSAQLDLINNLDRTATYRIRFVNRRMTESGDMLELTRPGPGDKFADSLLKYSPRQVMLPPGATQTVRILLRKPADLPVGEYRSHLLFERVPDAATPPTIGKGAQKSDGIAIQIQPLINVTIPVIVRHGDTQAQVGLTNLRLQRPQAGTPATLSFELRRSGNRSVFGDLEATFVVGGKAYAVGVAKGVAVYVPNPLRGAKLTLTPPPGIPLAQGRLELTYRERAEEGGAVLARAALQIH